MVFLFFVDNIDPFRILSAIDPAYGMSSASHADAEIKQLLVKDARRRIALADHSKFGKQSYALVGPVTDVDIVVTDAGVDEKYVQHMRDQGVQVVIAQLPNRIPAE